MTSLLNTLYASVSEGLIPTSAYLVGDGKSGRSSLAFWAAYEEAGRGGVPLFVTQRQKFQAGFPHFCSPTSPNRMHTDNVVEFYPQILQRILIKYVETHDDLITLLASMSYFKPLPTFIVLDNLTTYIPTRTAVLEHYLLVTGLLDDTLHHLNTYLTTRSSSSGDIHNHTFIPRVRLLVIDNIRDAIITSSIARYFDSILTIETSIQQPLASPTSLVRQTTTAMPNYSLFIARRSLDEHGRRLSGRTREVLFTRMHLDPSTGCLQCILNE